VETPESSDIEALRHQIDALTPQVGQLSRSDVITWCLINYMAGARDLFVDGGDSLPWAELADPVDGVAGRRSIAATLSARIDELIATTTGTPGVNPNGGDDA
jgi:hypothetical protein